MPVPIQVNHPTPHRWAAITAAIALACLLVTTACLPLDGPLGATAIPSGAPTASPAGERVGAVLETPAPADRGGTAPAGGSPPVPTAAPSPTATATLAPPIAPVPTASPAPTIAPASSGQAALRHAAALAEGIGSRPAGSPEEKRAAEYIARELEQLGYAVEVRAFEFERFRDQGAELSVQPEGVALPSRTMRLSPAGTVTAPLVDAGSGGPDDLAAAGVDGKIALIERGQLRFGVAAAAAAEAGAVAVVVSNNEAGLFVGDLGEPGSIPVISISKQSGDNLRARLAAGPVTVRLAVRAETLAGVSYNVVGERAGPERGTVLIGAHYDSVPAGPGANDNASGVGVALETAAILAASAYPYTVQIVAFGAEEIGLLGSRHYVGELSEAEFAAIIAMVNLDMVGVGNELRVGGTDDLVALAEELAGRGALPTRRLAGAGGLSSDHAPFVEAGVPALFITRTPDPNYHTIEDKVVHLDAEHLAESGRLAQLVLAELAAIPVGGR